MTQNEAKYRLGDRVRIMDEWPSEGFQIEKAFGVRNEWLGKVMTIISYDDQTDRYRLLEDDPGIASWDCACFEGLAEPELQIESDLIWSVHNIAHAKYEIIKQLNKMQEKIDDITRYYYDNLVDDKSYIAVKAHISAEQAEVNKYMEICEKALSTLIPRYMDRRDHPTQLTEEEEKLLYDAIDRYLP